jgi:hypothetical protein
MLTFVTVSVTYGVRIKSRSQDAVRVMPDGKGPVRCLRAKPHQLCSRAARASCLPALRPACGVLRCNRARCRRSDPRQFGIVFREAWPELSLGDESPSGENRGGTPAGERARKRRAAQAAYSVARPAPAGAGHETLRLPAVRFLYVPEASRKELLRHCEERQKFVRSFPRKRESSLGPRLRGTPSRGRAEKSCLFENGNRKTRAQKRAAAREELPIASSPDTRV